MTDRLTADTINSDALDALYDRLEAAETENDKLRAWHERCPDREPRARAEAALARVELLRDKWLAWPADDMHHGAGTILAAYLSGEAYGSDEPRPAPVSSGPAATQATETDPGDLAGYAMPDPPIGCLTLTAAEPIDTAHRYCILCGNQFQPGHTCDPAGLRTVYGSLVDRAERDRARADTAEADLAEEQRLYRLRTEQWQRAIEDRGHAEQQRDQLAATLREVLAQFTHETHPGRRCLQTGHVPIGTVDRWRAVLEPAKEQH